MTFPTDTGLEQLTAEAVDLLSGLIRLPSVSRDEARAADFIEDFMRRNGLDVQRDGNNVWSCARGFREGRPTLLLNAHLDTVKPVAGWQRDPFTPTLEGDRLYGLGSNDCGGGLVALLQTFRLLEKAEDLPFNLLYLASAEEEVSGRNGIERALKQLPPPDVAIVGEPTGLQPAIAEKGLMVLDVTATGRSGHAARDEGLNAIYEALPDIHWFQTHRFPRTSPLLGSVRMTVTVIQAGTQHNVVPDRCTFTVDVRSNECYTNIELLDEIRKNIHSEVQARSTRLNSSHIPADHPLVVRCVELGGRPYGSPTLSDQALLSCPSLKLGPGDSARSHTADEYIKTGEIRDGIAFYYQLLKGLKRI